MDIERLINKVLELLNAWNQEAASVYRNRPPWTEDEICGLERSQEIELPDSLRRLYRKVRGIARNGEFDAEFIPYFSLCAPDMILEDSSQLQFVRMPSVLDGKRMFPFLSDWGGAIIYVTEVDEDGVRMHDPEGGVEHEKMHVSIEKFLETTIAMFENGIYFNDDIDIDDELTLRLSIGKQLNPQCEYWTRGGVM